MEAVAGSKCSMVAVVAEAVEALVVMGSWGSMMMVAEVDSAVAVETRKSTHSADHQYRHHLSVYTKPTKLSPPKT